MNYVKGNLLDMAQEGLFDAIVHGCNCFNVMGAGIAKQIAVRYPAAKEADAATDPGDINKLGNYTRAHIGEVFTIFNAYTQHGTSKAGEDVFEYDSFKLILKKLAHDYPCMRWGFPMIGAGLGGGDWKRIESLIMDFDKVVSAEGGTVTIVEFQP